MKTITEQTTAFEATRQAKSARMSELMTKAGDEGVTLDAEQTEEYDGLDVEIEAIDAHLVPTPQHGGTLEVCAVARRRTSTRSLRLHNEVFALDTPPAGGVIGA
jgi:hypothetical protein